MAGDEGGREAGLQRRVLVLEEVRVEVGRDRDGAVSHPPADAVQVLALVRHQGRVGMPQVMEADVAKPRALRSREEHTAVEGRVVERATVRT